MDKNEKRELLERSAYWLNKHNYIDSDYYTEEPHAVDAFLEDENKKLTK